MILQNMSFSRLKGSLSFHCTPHFRVFSKLHLIAASIKIVPYHTIALRNRQETEKGWEDSKGNPALNPTPCERFFSIQNEIGHM